MLSTNPEGRPEKQPRTWELISSYSRAQAIADGVLVDVTSMAKEAGIRFPVALTRAVFERYVRIPEGVTAQDETGRLWDLLFMFSVAARKAGGQSEIVYSLHVRNSNRAGTPPLVQLKALCGPGDNGKPVITIMLPEEKSPVEDFYVWSPIRSKDADGQPEPSRVPVPDEDDYPF